MKETLLRPARRDFGRAREVIRVSKQNWRQASQLLMLGSLAGVILAGVGATGTDLWLASTQWLLVSVILAIFGIYARLEA